MTREEALDIIRFVFLHTDNHLNDGRQISADDIHEALIMACAALCKNSISSNLDEAAEEYALDVKAKPFGGLVEDAFKAGAEWRSSQIPKLPDNVDEAAGKYADIQNKNFLRPEIVKNIFKAGAKWMEGQGASFNTKVGWIDGPTVLDWPDDILDKFEMGDEVVVQIRKKQ